MSVAAFFKRFRQKSKAHLSIGISSALIQGATFFLIYVFKSELNETNFVYVITQLSWAGIIASIAGLRLEILLFQSLGTITRGVVIVPFVAVVLTVLVVSAFDYAVAAALVHPPFLLVDTIWVCMGLAFQEIQGFFCVQQGKWKSLLVTRAAQALALTGFSLLLILEIIDTDGAFALRSYGLMLILPSLVWLGFFYSSTPRSPMGALRTSLGTAIFRRGTILSGSVLVNALYVNVPVLVASFTQTVSFAADFGFILKILTGPVTLIRQVFGQIFMARCLAIDFSASNAMQLVRSYMTRTVFRSAAAYLLIMTVLIPLLVVFKDRAKIENISMVFVLVLAVAAQCMVNPIASMRILFQGELEFFLIDILRSMILTGVLFVPLNIDYSIKFTIISTCLYFWYLAYSYRRLRRGVANSGLSLGRNKKL